MDASVLVAVFDGVYLVGVHFLLLFAKELPEADLRHHLEGDPDIILHLHVERLFAGDLHKAQRGIDIHIGYIYGAVLKGQGVAQGVEADHHQVLIGEISRHGLHGRKVHQYTVEDLEVHIGLGLVDHRGPVGMDQQVAADLPADDAFYVLVDHDVLSEIIEFQHQLFDVHVFDTQFGVEGDLAGIAAVEMGIGRHPAAGHLGVEGIEIDLLAGQHPHAGVEILDPEAVIADPADIDVGIEIDKGDAEEIEPGGMGGRGFCRHGGDHGFRGGIGCSRWIGGGRLNFFLFGGGDIVRQLIDIEEPGGPLQIILFFPAQGILAGVEPHADVEVGVADLAAERVDLDEVVGTEFYIAADTVQLVFMCFQCAGDIGDLYIGEFEHGVITQFRLASQPDVGTDLLPVILGHILPAFFTQQVPHGQPLGFQIEGQQGLSLLHFIEPEGVVIDATLECYVAAVDAAGKVAQQDGGVADREVGAKIMKGMRVVLERGGEPGNAELPFWERAGVLQFLYRGLQRKSDGEPIDLLSCLAVHGGVGVEQLSQDHLAAAGMQLQYHRFFLVMEEGGQVAECAGEMKIGMADITAKRVEVDKAILHAGMKVQVFHEGRIAGDAEGEVGHLQFALDTLGQLAHGLVIGEVNQFLEIHLQVDMSRYALQVLDPEKGADKAQLQLAPDLHKDLWIGEVAHDEISFEDPFIRPGAHIHQPEFGGLEGMIRAIGVVALEAKGVELFISPGVVQPGVLTGKGERDKGLPAAFELSFYRSIKAKFAVVLEIFQFFCHRFGRKGKQLTKVGLVTRDMEIDGIVMEKIDGAGEIEGPVPELYFADGQAEEFRLLVKGKLDIGLQMLMPEEGGVAGAGEVDLEGTFQIGADLAVLVAQGRLYPLDIGCQALAIGFIPIGDAHVLQYEFLDVKIQRLCRGGCFRGGVGGDPYRLHDIEVSRTVLCQIEMTVL